MSNTTYEKINESDKIRQGRVTPYMKYILGISLALSIVAVSLSALALAI